MNTLYEICTNSIDILLLYILIKVTTQIQNLMKILEICILKIKNKFEKMFDIPLLLPP